MPKEVSVSGVVWGAFKHRFAIKTDSGKTLIDIGPKGAEKFDLSEGDRVEAKGEKKPSEVKVHSLKVGGKTHKMLFGHRGGAEWGVSHYRLRPA